MGARKNSRSFPPKALQDLPLRSASNYMRLIRTCRDNSLALALGAGVSTSAGLPPWDRLLRRICGAFFYHWEYLSECNRAALDKPPSELSIVFAHEYTWSDEAIKTAESFTAGDSLLIAQQIKNCVRALDWKWLLRRALYDDEQERRHTGHSSHLIEALAKMCLAPLGISAVINYNYDDLFERCLKGMGVRHKPIYLEPNTPQTGLLPVYHPHGFLPLDGGPAETEFVLAETDYHQHVAEPHSWANMVQLHSFATRSCIFVGASLKDPAMRRMLRLAQTSHLTPHFAFLPISTPTTARNAMFDALFDRDAFRLGVSVIRYDPIEKDGTRHKRLGELLELLPGSVADETILWL